MANFNEQFVDGVLSAEPDVVADALYGGADPNVSCAQADGIPYTHALQEILVTNAKVFTSEGDADKRLRLTLIAREILEMGPQLLNESGFMGTTTLDEIICPAETRQRTDKDWLDLAATAVITTLAQDVELFRDTYKINFGAIFAGLGEPAGGDEAKHTVVRMEAMETIKAVHARVCERLNNPTTIKEQVLSTKAEEIGFWMHPLQASDIAELPRPSHYLSECSRKFEQAAAALQKSIDAPYTPEKEDRIQAILETAKYAQEEIKRAAADMRTRLEMCSTKSFVDKFSQAQFAREEVKNTPAADKRARLAVSDPKSFVNN